MKKNTLILLIILSTPVYSFEVVGLQNGSKLKKGLKSFTKLDIEKEKRILEGYKEGNNLNSKVFKDNIFKEEIYLESLIKNNESRCDVYVRTQQSAYSSIFPIRPHDFQNCSDLIHNILSGKLNISCGREIDSAQVERIIIGLGQKYVDLKCSDFDRNNEFRRGWENQKYAVCTIKIQAEAKDHSRANSKISKTKIEYVSPYTPRTKDECLSDFKTQFDSYKTLCNVDFERSENIPLNLTLSMGESDEHLRDIECFKYHNLVNILSKADVYEEFKPNSDLLLFKYEKLNEKNYQKEETQPPKHPRLESHHKNHQFIIERVGTKIDNNVCNILIRTADSYFHLKGFNDYTGGILYKCFYTASYIQNHLTNLSCGSKFKGEMIQKLDVYIHGSRAAIDCTSVKQYSQLKRGWDDERYKVCQFEIFYHGFQNSLNDYKTVLQPLLPRTKEECLNDFNKVKNQLCKYDEHRIPEKIDLELHGKTKDLKLLEFQCDAKNEKIYIARKEEKREKEKYKRLAQDYLNGRPPDRRSVEYKESEVARRKVVENNLSKEKYIQYNKILSFIKERRNQELPYRLYFHANAPELLELIKKHNPLEYYIMESTSAQSNKMIFHSKNLTEVNERLQTMIDTTTKRVALKGLETSLYRCDLYRNVEGKTQKYKIFVKNNKVIVQQKDNIHIQYLSESPIDSIERFHYLDEEYLLYLGIKKIDNFGKVEELGLGVNFYYEDHGSVYTASSKCTDLTQDRENKNIYDLNWVFNFTSNKELSRLAAQEILKEMGIIVKHDISILLSNLDKYSVNNSAVNFKKCLFATSRPFLRGFAPVKYGFFYNEGSNSFITEKLTLRLFMKSDLKEAGVEVCVDVGSVEENKERKIELENMVYLADKNSQTNQTKNAKLKTYKTANKPSEKDEYLYELDGREIKLVREYENFVGRLYLYEKDKTKLPLSTCNGADKYYSKQFVGCHAEENLEVLYWVGDLDGDGNIEVLLDHPWNKDRKRELIFTRTIMTEKIEKEGGK